MKCHKGWKLPMECLPDLSWRSGPAEHASAPATLRYAANVTGLTVEQLRYEAVHLQNTKIALRLRFLCRFLWVQYRNLTGGVTGITHPW